MKNGKIRPLVDPRPLHHHHHQDAKRSAVAFRR